MRLKVMSREETCQQIAFGMMYGTLSWSCCLWKNRTWSLNGAAARFPSPPQPPQATSVACRRAAAWGEEEEWGARCRLGKRKRSGSRTTVLPPRRRHFGPELGAAAAAVLVDWDLGVKRPSGRESPWVNERALELVSFRPDGYALLGRPNTAISS